jgi:predicted RNase H-like HicB family nuclease
MNNVNDRLTLTEVNHKTKKGKTMEIDASINYEVALDVLGQDLLSLREAIRLENEKPKPSLVAITFLKSRIGATDELQNSLQLKDTDTINQILDYNNRLFRLGRYVRYPVILTQDTGGYIVTFPDVPEAMTQGDSYAEAMEMAKDALESSVELYTEKNQSFPTPSEIKEGQSFIQILLQ